MNLTQKILGVAALGLALINVSSAQEAASTTTQSAGLLGVQYVEVGFGYLDVNHSDRGGYSLGADVNVPVTANLDLNVGYSHSWVENNDSFYDNSVSVGATAYLTEGAFRPFASARLGYVWVGSGDDDFGVWSVGTGVEYAINSTTAVAVFADYGDSFEEQNEGVFSGTAVLSHWFTSSFAGTAGVSLIEHGHVGYGVSAIFKF